MNWHQCKKVIMKKLMLSMANISNRIDDREIPDYKLIQELDSIKKSIDRFKAEINKQRIVELNNQQEDLI